MVTRYDPCNDWVGVEMAEFGDYVSYEDFQDLVKAFDALIAAAEATHKGLVATPEYRGDNVGPATVAVLNDAINDAIKLLEPGIKEAKEFE